MAKQLPYKERPFIYSSDMHCSSDSKKTIILWKLQPLAWIILNNVTVAKSSTPTHRILQGRVLFALQVDATWFA
jgi:hypothetical protein